MRCGVIIFPGSNCDRDLMHVLENVLEQEVVELWHKDTHLPDVEAVFLPGGFSYGDYLRSGAIARFSKIMPAVIDFASNGGVVMGICNGFQILCEAGLLPGALLHNTSRQFISKNIYIKPADINNPLTRNLSINRAYKMPIAHGEGNYYTDANTLSALKENGQILFHYCDSDGNITAESNPNGSLKNIAGVCNAGKNVFGLMPHPERAAEEVLGSTDGKLIFQSLFAAISSMQHA